MARIFAPREMNSEANTGAMEEKGKSFGTTDESACGGQAQINTDKERKREKRKGKMGCAKRFHEQRRGAISDLET
ncbi:MAG TPA: hypothetical protein VMH00_05515 [Candidatus Limnocylindrales bacterium]|nr:hypothetical protein [Candidatus Limnocylindrales bacterium]